MTLDFKRYYNRNMKLDKNYFNNLTLNYVKNDYYNADDVDNALVEIRKNALEMCDQIDTLTAQLNDALKANEDLKQLLAESKSKEETEVKKATEDAAAILEQVEQKKKEIEQIQVEREDRLVGIIAEVFERMKKEHREDVSEINSQWQSFLTSLEENSAPKDLSAKVEKIALEMQEISDNMPKKKKK